MKQGQPFYPPSLRYPKDRAKKFGIPDDLAAKRQDFRTQLHLKRTIKMLRCIAGGMTTTEISLVMGWRVGTTETYRIRLMKDMGAVNSCQLLKIAYDEGLLKVGEYYENGELR